MTCSDNKKVTWREVLDNGKQIANEYPFEAGVWYPGGDMTTNRFAHAYRVFLFHLIPAYLIDFLMLCFGQKRLLVFNQSL